MENHPGARAHLSVSIVLYYSPIALLLSTVTSLYAACLRASDDGELESVSILVVDNSQSQPYSAVVCKALDKLEFDHSVALTYIESGENHGFGAGHNQVLPGISSDYHLVLNPDVELAVSALSHGLSAMREDAQLALASPRVLGRTGEQEFLCKCYPSVGVLLLRAFAPAFVRDYFRAQLDRYEMHAACVGDQNTDVLLASGCFMLMRSGAFAGVSGFNTGYFLYFEDFDLSLRLAEHGRLRYVPKIEITHHGGYAATKGLRHIWYFIKSGTRFFNDHGWKWI